MNSMLEAKLTHLLALHEGLYDLKAQYLEDRKAAEYNAVFTQREPLVSICVATCNRAELLLNRCLPSLLRQSYQNLQIVVVGDHCTDETEYRLSKLRDSRIVFSNLSQRGPYPPPGQLRWFVAGSNAMNRALELCEGSFIAHLDDDDEARPDRISILLQTALAKKVEFLWHKLLYQNRHGLWRMVGGSELERGQVTGGSIFYHRYFSRIGWDVHAYRQGEPGDWNRIRKIKFLNPTSDYVDECLTIHYVEDKQPTFELQEGETLLEL